jgi:hypothetical protein
LKSNSTIKALHAELRAGTQAVPQPTKVCLIYKKQEQHNSVNGSSFCDKLVLKGNG